MADLETFSILIAADVRAHLRQTITASDRDAAIAKAVEWLQNNGHRPEAIGFKIDDEDGSEIQGDVSVLASIEDDEDSDENAPWHDVPEWDGQPRFAAIRDQRDKLRDALREIIALATVEKPAEPGDLSEMEDGTDYEAVADYHTALARWEAAEIARKAMAQDSAR